MFCDIVNNNLISDLAVHANDIIVNAINNNCSWDTLREFIISNPGWYCFIKPTTFRAIVVKALKRSSTVANQLFVIGQEIEIYPQLIVSCSIIL